MMSVVIDVVLAVERFEQRLLSSRMVECHCRAQGQGRKHG